MTSDEDAVRAANEAFYAAFTRRDLAAMDALWSHTQPVCCIHPGWGALHERDAIIASWKSIFGGDGPPNIHCVQVHIRVIETLATVICEEVLDDARLSATNGFVFEDGDWRLWHHHAAPIARRVTPRRGPLLN